MTRPAADSADGVPQGTLALIAGLPGWTVAVLALSAVGWGALAWLVVDMGHPLAQLTMPASSQWSVSNVLAVQAMWALMMAAMMLPSALPMVLTFVGMGQRSRHDRARAHGFVAAYLVVWFLFSAAAMAAQWALQRAGWVDAMLVSTSAPLTGALLLIAGVYQFSPLKRTCLSGCQTPLGFLLGAWRPCLRGAFVMGLHHGVLCVGCCWALMALLFVGGVMNLAWVAALSLAVGFEKLLPRGERLATVLGLALMLIGSFKLLAVSGWQP